MIRGEKSSGRLLDVPLLGFLTVVADDDLGLVGGYLLLDAAARPVEFHCTAPLRPTRAQRILYGPTLSAYLHGEQIAPALVAKSEHAPLAVLTDVEAVLAARTRVDVPLALVASGVNDGATRLATFEIGGQTLAVIAKNAGDRERIVERLAAIEELFDLTEPLNASGKRSRKHNATRKAARLDATMNEPQRTQRVAEGRNCKMQIVNCKFALCIFQFSI